VCLIGIFALAFGSPVMAWERCTLADQPLPAPVRYQHLLEGVEVLDAFARAEDDRFQRIVGQVDRPVIPLGTATTSRDRGGAM
jgi:hypothetical protein